MLAKILSKLASFLERLGRQDVRLMNTGQVIFERYYLLPWTGRGSAFKFPNIILHHMIEPDGEFNWHDHGRNCISIILTGGYDDHRVDKKGNKYVLKRRALSISFLRYNTVHNVSDVLPNTWTFFLVGPEKKDVLFAGNMTGKYEIRKGAEATGLRKISPEALDRLKRRQAKALSKTVGWKDKNEMVD